MVVAMAIVVAAGACTQRTNTPTLSPSPAVEETAALPPTTQSSALPVAAPAPTPEAHGPARLDEVRLIETGGQRSVLFRFSHPPEGIDYFPLRNPNRLVVDIKGSVEPPAKIQTHKTSDAIVSAVRVGTYQGKLRLVIDLKNATPPQFSVDSYETLVTAFIGEKDINKSAAHGNAQVLFLSEDARSILTANAHGQSEKTTEATTAPSANVTSASSPDPTQPQPPTAAPPLTEEKIAAAPAASPTPEASQDTTHEIAQVTPVQQDPMLDPRELQSSGE